MSESIFIYFSTRSRCRALLVTLLLLASCAQQPVVRRTAPPPDPVANAERLLRNNNFAAAGPALLAVADNSPRSTELKALAALAFQDSGELSAADEILSDLGNESSDNQPELKIAKARSMLETGFNSDALALAEGTDLDNKPAYVRGVRERVIAIAALATGDFRQAATASLNAFELPAPGSAHETLAATAWQAISRLPQTELESGFESGTGSRAGWYGLALAARRQAQIQAEGGSEDALGDWALNYPGHTAAALLEQVREQAGAISGNPRQVAVLLPFEGDLGQAATAIRDGIITAWYLDKRPERPALTFLSTTGQDIAAVYQQALSQGADFVVGPLQKDAVRELADSALAPRGVLALNVTDQETDGGLIPLGFYQFGLTPEDEASQVAGRARTAGSRALVITPDTPWGHRVSRAYQTTWEALGGTTLGSINYSGAPEEYSKTVKRALNVDLSEARAAALRQLLNRSLEFEPRRREDVDALLIGGFPGNVRQLVPQLRYFRAASIPSFATSHVFRGSPDTDRDADMDGLVFGDMPWIFGDADISAFQTVRRGWPRKSSTLARLYGFGVDAYRLIPHLGRMQFEPRLRVPGVTGNLWMESAVIRRDMSWYKFENGLPRREASEFSQPLL